MHRLADLADALAQTLEVRERALELEQTHAGLDAMSEVELHSVLAAGARDAGVGVLTEIPFPSQTESTRAPLAQRLGEGSSSDAHGERRAAHRRERERCDLVVLPEGKTSLLDPRDDLADEIAKADSLFADVAERATAPDPSACHPGDAWWLEFKVGYQFKVVDGWAGADKGYSAFVSGVLRDARKLNADALISRSACGVVLFTADRAIAEHDLATMMHRLLDRDAPIRESVVRHVPIADRIGNACCSLALLRVRNDAAADSGR